MFQGNILLPTSGLKSKPGKTPASRDLLLQKWFFFLGLPTDPEDGGEMFLKSDD
jgi:hypothetical protein